MVIGQERWTTCSLLLSLGLLLLLVLPLFVLVLGHPRIDQLRAVLHHLPDQPLRLKLVQGLPRQRPAGEGVEAVDRRVADVTEGGGLHDVADDELPDLLILGDGLAAVDATDVADVAVAVRK